MSIDNLSSSTEEKVISAKELFEKIDTINNPMSEDSDIKRSNGNINGQSVMGKMLQMGAEASKIYALNKLLPKRFARAHQDGDIHIHDLDFYPTKTTTCLQIPLGEMLKNGVWNEHGFLRSPKSIATAAALAAIIMQSSQNQFHGGQSFPSFDFDLAPFVKMSYEKHKSQIAKTLEDLKPECEHEDYQNEIEKEAWEATEKETLQAMEGFVHNLNTMHSRAGAQVVFSSVNFGLDTSKEGRLISKCLMQAQCNGLGKHETPIFPILVFKVKDGINGLPGDPNYDLFEQSIEVTAKRLFPNWIFEDAPFNLYSYNKVGPEKSVATMGALRGKERITLKHNDLVYSQIRFDDAFRLVKGEKEIQGNKEEYFSAVSRYEEECKEKGVSPFYTTKEDKLSGIYRITNKRDLKTYIGSSTNIQQRFHDHRARLKFGTFDSGFTFNQPQNPDDFCYDIIELCDKKDFVEKENYYIKKYNTQTFGYNKRDGLDEKDNRAVNPSAFKVKIQKEYKEAFASEKDEYIKTDSWFVWDNGQWTPLKGIMKIASEGAPDLMSIKYELRNKVYSIDATSDHPFVTNHGRIRVKDLDFSEDKLIADDGSECNILDVNFLNIEEDVYDLETYTDTFDVSRIRSHNCRTRLCTDVYEEGDGTSTKRGNASFTSINLPRLALKVMEIEDEEQRIKKFYKLLDNILSLVHDQLLARYYWQCSAQPEEFAYLYNNNAVIGSEKWHETGQIEEYIKHYSLSIGFIGLAETLKCLIGEHHGESERAQKLGLEIVKYMRDYCDQKAFEEHLNWSLLGTPAEGLAGRFTKIDQKKYGIIPGVTDREYYTNSSHVPVYYNISIKDKINKEAPYHALENAGHICYIELDGDPSHNLEAVKQIVNQMKQAGIGYGAINHPVDTCQDCRYQGCNMTSCPVCGSTNISYLRRITGYLVGTLDRWNDGKKAEERDRVKHT